MAKSRPRQQWPIYIPSKGRARHGLTWMPLERLGMSWRVIVEPQERQEYIDAGHDPKTLLILDPDHVAEYQTFDPEGDDENRPKGSGPARNFAWDHARELGADWHWVIDDNIRYFGRLHKNERIPLADDTAFAAMEDFLARYSNTAMGGPTYEMFAVSREAKKPFTLNTRIFSCNLIRTDIPLRWECRYNEDADLSIRLLKDGWCTVLFNSFFGQKVRTQKMPGGNTDTIYTDTPTASGKPYNSTLRKTMNLVRRHPEMVKLVHRYGREHHHIDWSGINKQQLIRDPNYQPPSENPYRMRRVQLEESPARAHRKKLQS